MGRIYRILKRSSHVSIALDVTPVKAAPRAAAGRR
jgi:hypothetical protein